VYCEDNLGLIGIPNVYEGSFVFSHFSGTTHTVEQIWDGGTNLENHRLWYSFAYYDKATGDDTGAVTYEFLNASDVVVGSLYDSGTLNPDDAQWHTVSGGPITAPANTQKVKVTLTCDEGIAGFCDIFFDSFSLTGETPTAVSLQSITATSNTAFIPVLIATLLLALAGGVALRRRS